MRPSSAWGGGGTGCCCQGSEGCGGEGQGAESSRCAFLGPVFGGDWILLFVEYKGEWEGKVVDWGEGCHDFADFFLVAAI